MKRILGALLIAAALLAGCGDDKGGGSPATDSEDYTGAPQTVASKRVDPAVMGTRTKYKNERYCSARKSNGSCKTYSTRKKADGTETYVADDEDHVLVLADGTEVDVDREEYDRYQVGSVYP